MSLMEKLFTLTRILAAQRLKAPLDWFLAKRPLAGEKWRIDEAKKLFQHGARNGP
jgi:hypothetical protein